MLSTNRRRNDDLKKALLQKKNAFSLHAEILTAVTGGFNFQYREANSYRKTHILHVVYWRLYFLRVEQLLR